jgi:3'-phosphoadenosine 5'-phosphosulfate sulfotransferase (PAPS reductase)/FAD synthetase
MKGKFVDGHDVLHPIYDWKESRVWSFIRTEELPIHPVYHWHKRLSCFCCPLQPIGCWKCLRKYHPDLWEKSLELEEKAGKPWLPNFTWLKDLDTTDYPRGLVKPRIITRRFRGQGKNVEVR